MKKVMSLILAISVFISGGNLCAFAKKDESSNKNVIVNTATYEDKGFLRTIAETTLASVGPMIITFGAAVILSKVVQVVSTHHNLMKAKKAAGIIEVASNPVKVLQDFDFIMKDLKGQEAAKKQLKSIILGIVDKNAKHIKHGDRKKAGPGANIIYLIGPSGVGKSFAADKLRVLLSGTLSNPYVVEASDVDKQSKASATEQLFGMSVKRLADKEYYEQSPIISRLEATPQMTLVINEYDKLCTPELDEKIRTLKDQGYICVNGKKIDGSGLDVIITSNESRESMESGNLEEVIVDDGTGSRTHVQHDKAFRNRVNLVVFDNLTKEAYEEIALPKFDTLVKDLKEEYDINVNLGDTVKKISKKVEEINQGARPIFNFIDKLNADILNNVVLKRLEDNSYRGIELNIDYDEVTNNFVIEEQVKEVSNVLDLEELVAA